MTREPTIQPVIPDYELLKPIGRGSYGEVWLARSVTGVFRVIKIVRRDRFEDERPFLRELEGISRYQAAVSGRPRQLALLHVGRNDAAGYFYYVMEPADDAEAGSSIDPARYVPLTLKELFARRGRLPAMESVQLALELARGLAVLHGENLIHRDIKPSNIIFVQRVPKLADVGLVAANEASLTYVGTPGYVPPEGPGSVVADIYSLGKVLYETATGLDRNEFPRLPSDLTEGSEAALFREINAIVLKACHPNPIERHQTAEAMVRDLELVQAGKSVAFYEGLRRQFRAIAVGAAVVALAAASITAMLYWRSGILEEANEQTRHALYRSDLAVAQLAKASGDLGRARAALQRQVPKPGETDLRGLEWAILARDVRGEGAPLQPLTNGVAIRKIDIDPTGRWVAASFIDDRVGIWDLRNGRVVRVLDNAKVLGGFTPEGLLVVDEPIRALRFESPTNGVVKRIETGKRLFQILSDGRLFVVSPTGDFVLQVINPTKLQSDIEFNVSQRFSGLEASSQTISPNGQWVALGLFQEVGARRARWISAINMHQSAEAWRIQVPGRILWLRSSPDNNCFVANIGGLTPTIFRYSSTSLPMRLEGHTARVQDASFSFDGKYIATASADQTIRVWNVNTGLQIAILRGLGRPASSVHWSKNGDFIIAADDSGAIRVFQFPPTELPKSLGGLYSDIHGDLRFDSQGKRLAATATTNSVLILNVNSLKKEQSVTNIFQPIRFSEDGKFLHAFGNDWSLRVADLNTETVTNHGPMLPDSFSVNSWCVSPTGYGVAFTGHSNKLAVVDVIKRRASISQSPDASAIWAITFSPDTKEVWTGSANGVIRRWSANETTPLGVVTQLEGDLQALAISPNGRWLAAGLFNDASIRIWDNVKQRWLAPLYAHRRFVVAIAFTSDSGRLISGGTDGQTVVWRVPQFEQIATFELEGTTRPQGDEGISVLRMSPDESVLGGLTEDGRVQLWRTR
ncbi:MAG: protein kinase [Verrucomicrobiales bacterium]|nr:protein kinase [Verrucomicrobiales bacterium]